MYFYIYSSIFKLSITSLTAKFDRIDDICVKLVLNAVGSQNPAALSSLIEHVLTKIDYPSREATTWQLLNCQSL